MKLAIVGRAVICGNGKLRITEVGRDGRRCRPTDIINSIRKRLT